MMHLCSSLFSCVHLSGLGGWYSYRMSKAALNMATRNLSIELGRSRPKVSLSLLIDVFLFHKYHKEVRQCWRVLVGIDNMLRNGWMIALHMHSWLLSELAYFSRWCACPYIQEQ